MEHLGSIVVVVVLAAVVGLIIRYLVKQKKKGGCCGNCTKCPSCCEQHGWTAARTSEEP